MKREFRLPELDGLRAVAISAVMAYHFLREPVPHHHWLDYPTRLLAIGWGGVDLFFVLSGFLIGGILLDTRERPAAFRDFLIRRALRILPLYVALLLAFYLLRQILGGWMFDGALPAWTYLSLTQDFATPIFGRDAWFLGPTWSLAVEVQAYVLLGGLLVFLPRRMIVPMLVTGVLVAVSSRAIASASGHGLAGYFMLPARIDGACLGALVAAAMRIDGGTRLAARSNVLLVATALLFACATLVAAAGNGPGSLATNTFTHMALALGSAALISALVCRRGGGLNKLLSWAPAVAFGEISYGVYLLHKPVVGTLHTVAGRDGVILDSGLSIAVTVSGIALTVLIAAASWRWFERPIIRWSHGVTRGDPTIVPNTAVVERPVSTT